MINLVICLSCIFPCTCFYFEYIGFGGQKFQIDMMPKVRTIRDMCPHMNVEVDGGLALDTIDAAATAGANMIVAGSSVFKGIPSSVISALRKSIEIHGNQTGDD